MKECLNCKYSKYFEEQQVYCNIYDDLVEEIDCCGLWCGKNE